MKKYRRRNSNEPSKSEIKFLEQFKDMIGSSSQAWYNGLRAVTTANDRNAITGRPYSGFNVFILAFARMRYGWKSNRWISSTKCNELGGLIKKGEHGQVIAFWKFSDKKKEEDEEKEEEEETPRKKEGPKLFTHYVFNLEQTTLTDDEIPDEFDYIENRPIEIAEDILKDWYDKPEFIEVDGTQTPCYSPTFDTIKVPNIQLYKDSQYYYMTLFHECIHSTGAKKRLSRDGITKFDVFGSDKYAKEELVAETGASLLGAYCEFEEEQFVNAASYMKSWLSHTEESKSLKSLNMVLFSAFSQAMEAYRYILGIHPEHETEKEM